MQEIKFKNTSRIDENTVLEMQKKITKKMSMMVAFLWSVLFVILGVALLFVNTFLGVSVITCGTVGSFTLVPFIVKDSTKKQTQKLFQGKKFLVTFEFYDDSLNVLSESSESGENNFIPENSIKVSYDEIKKCTQNDLYIYLFLNKSQSLILDKKGMLKGTADEIVSFLNEKGVKIDKNTLGI